MQQAYAVEKNKSIGLWQYHSHIHTPTAPQTNNNHPVKIKICTRKDLYTQRIPDGLTVTT